MAMLNSLPWNCCASLLAWSKAQAQQGTSSTPGRCSLLKFSVCATEQALPGRDGSPGKAAPCPGSQEATAWLSSAGILVTLARHSDVVSVCSPVVIFVLSSPLCAGSCFLSSSQQMCFSFVYFSLFLTCCHVSVELSDRGNPSLNNSQMSHSWSCLCTPQALRLWVRRNS